MALTKNDEEPITFPPVGHEADFTWLRRVSTNRLHGFGRLILQISQISVFAALDAYGEAMIPVDIVTYATRYVRDPPLASAPQLRLARTSLAYNPRHNFVTYVAS
jgi:hypothetical protein